jgi:hypothetical protein
VLLTRRGEINPLWRAAVPTLPDCVVEAPTRREAIERIRERIADIASHTEILRVEVSATPKANGDNGLSQPESQWPGFGLFRHDPTWDELFESIEEGRNAQLVGG